MLERHNLRSVNPCSYKHTEQDFWYYLYATTVLFCTQEKKELKLQHNFGRSIVQVVRCKIDEDTVRVDR